MEKLTISFIAIERGNGGKTIADSETFEAETKREMAEQIARFIREVADEFEKALR